VKQNFFWLVIFIISYISFFYSPIDEEHTAENPTKENEPEPGSNQPKEWLYLDDNNEEQGPFTLFEVQGWWFGGLLPPHLRIKKSSDPSYTQEIWSHPEIQDYSKYYYAMYPTLEGSLDSTNTNTATTADESYTAENGEGQVDPYDVSYGYPAAMYPGSEQMQGYVPAPSTNSVDDKLARQIVYQDYVQTATFNMRTGRFQAGGRWSDSATRQMAHYFDVDAWQKQCQEAAASGKRKRPVKVSKNLAKKYKENKKKKSRKYQWLFED